MFTGVNEYETMNAPLFKRMVRTRVLTPEERDVPVSFDDPTNPTAYSSVGVFVMKRVEVLVVVAIKSVVVSILTPMSTVVTDVAYKVSSHSIVSVTTELAVIDPVTVRLLLTITSVAVNSPFTNDLEWSTLVFNVRWIIC
jgi:hypothetical protein